MKYIIFGLIAFVAVVATVAERQVRDLTPMDLVAIAPFGTTDLSVFTKKDLLVHPQSQIDYDVLNYAIRRRNNEGVYEKVANISRELVQPVLITNGKWIGLLDTSTGGPMDMFHIDENNVISNASTLDISLFAGGYLLSDDTVVSFDPPTEYPDSLEGMYSLNVTLRSRQYDSTKNAWTPINGTDLTFTGFVYMSGDFSTYRVYDEYMVIGRFTPASSDFIVNIYERLANKSWNFIEAVPITGGPASSLLRNIFYNGIDTIVVGWNDQDSGAGVVEISFFSKKNGTWTAQNFTSESVGYAPIPFGTSGTFLNANTFLQGTGMYYENDGSNKNARGALIFTRTEDGDWEPTIDLKGSPAVVFGAGLGVNDHDIIVSGMQSLGSQDITYYTITRCFLDPINVTCHNLQLDDCSTISPNQLYTINNPECGAISVLVDGLGFDKNGGQTRLTFTRGYGSSAVHCNATVACPNKVQNPVPVGGAPVAESVTSSSNSLQLGLFALLMSISYM